MAEAKGKRELEQPVSNEEAPAAKTVGLGIRLVPVADSDQPVVANYTTINVAPGMVFINFGFLEPAMLAALPRLAKEGRKLPERINGKLTVRVTMGYDALANLQQQLRRVLTGLGAAAKAKEGKGA